MNEEEQPIPKKGQRLGSAQRIVPKLDKQTLADLQSRNSTIRAAALVSVAELIIPAVPKKLELTKYDAASVKQSFLSVFEKIGGEDALEEWALSNPTEFFKMYERQGAAADKAGTQATQIIVQSNIPASALDAKTSQTFTIINDGINVTTSEESDADDFE